MDGHFHLSSQLIFEIKLIFSLQLNLVEFKWPPVETTTSLLVVFGYSGLATQNTIINQPINLNTFDPPGTFELLAKVD